MTSDQTPDSRELQQAFPARWPCLCLHFPPLRYRTVAEALFARPRSRYFCDQTTRVAGVVCHFESVRPSASVRISVCGRASSHTRRERSAAIDNSMSAMSDTHIWELPTLAIAKNQTQQPWHGRRHGRERQSDDTVQLSSFQLSLIRGCRSHAALSTVISGREVGGRRCRPHNLGRCKALQPMSATHCVFLGRTAKRAASCACLVQINTRFVFTLRASRPRRPPLPGSSESATGFSSPFFDV